MATRTLTTGVRCPFCGDGDATLTVDLTDVGRVTCGACDEAFTPLQAAQRLEALARRWRRVAVWLDDAPIATEDE